MSNNVLKLLSILSIDRSQFCYYIKVNYPTLINVRFKIKHSDIERISFVADFFNISVDEFIEHDEILSSDIFNIFYDGAFQRKIEFLKPLSLYKDKVLFDHFRTITGFTQKEAAQVFNMLLPVYKRFEVNSFNRNLAPSMEVSNLIGISTDKLFSPLDMDDINSIRAIYDFGFKFNIDKYYNGKLKILSN